MMLKVLENSPHPFSDSASWYISFAAQFLRYLVNHWSYVNTQTL